VRRLGKGDDRPVNTEADRAAVLAALESVSLVTVFDEAVPLPVVEIVRPDIYVKGGDYDMAAVPEAQLARTWGARGRWRLPSSSNARRARCWPRFAARDDCRR